MCVCLFVIGVYFAQIQTSIIDNPYWISVFNQQLATITGQPRQTAIPLSSCKKLYIIFCYYFKTTKISANVARMAIPVSTIQFESGVQISSQTPYIPQSGLDFMRGTPSLHIYQTFELNESLTALSSETRFSIRAPFNETLYVATESSKDSHRTYFGAGRPFRMHLLDKTNQEVLVIKRNMGFGLMCCSCVPQNVEIWLPPGDLIGVCKM